MNEVLKEHIREKAIALFLDKGYRNVTVNDICEACQITKPTFYKYAGSKDELILDLYDMTIQGLTSDPYPFLEVATYYERLLVVFDTLIKDTVRFGSDLFSQMLISNLTENRHSFDMRDSLTKLCLIIIQQAQDAGEIRNMNPAKTLYNTVAHLFIGYEVVWCINNGNILFAGNFFEDVIAILDVREDLRELHQKYC